MPYKNRKSKRSMQRSKFPIDTSKYPSAIRQYYNDQKDLLSSYEKDDECIRNGGEFGESSDIIRGDNHLSQLVLIMNVFLLNGKTFSAYWTKGTSLSIIASLLDSVVDITSGLAIWYATYLIMKTDVLSYPLGREVLQNMSIIFIGTIMGMGNAYVAYDGLMALAFGKTPPIFTIPSLMVLLGTILIKAILYWKCKKRTTKNAQVLAVDQLNDVCTNIVVIFGTLAAQYLTPICDPVVAVLVSGYIAFNWFSMVVEQFNQVVGGTCSREEYGRIARIIIKHPKVQAIDALLVYHAGQKAFVHPDYQLDGVIKYVPS